MSAFDHVWKRAGGHAFPISYDNGPDGGSVMHFGMSVRDYFAAKAMQGQLAFSPHDSFDKTNTPDEVAKLAYRFADAMLAEREKP